jgi:hypothetical protein
VKAAACGVAVLLAAGQSLSGPGAAGQLRFHHLHARTDDPAGSMNAFVSVAGGTRAILQGLGVGVRLGDQYVLFDRATDARGMPSADAAAQYAAAVSWLQARGFAVSPPQFSATRVGAAAPEGRLDHLAFAALDLARAVSALGRTGIAPSRQTAESAIFVDRDIAVEIVRDTDRPDAFWCPMHPDVRSASSGTCPLCSMELVPIPPRTFGHYRLDVRQVPDSAGTGVRALRIAIRHPETTQRVTALTVIHERLLHLFVVRRDLSFFAHVHPERSGDEFEVPIDLGPGAYVLIADFVPSGGAPQLVQRALVTPGYTASPFTVARVETDVADKLVDGVRIGIDAGRPRAGAESVLRFTVREASSGAPVSDLETYLGAAGHLLVTSADLTHAIHAHPEGAGGSPGPDGAVVFAPVLPARGAYKLWVQFQRNGKVITAPFAIEAR